MDVRWRGAFESVEVEVVHGEAFGHEPADFDWWSQVNNHSLGWVTARERDRLIGFVNVAWDGGVHAFVLDTIVVSDRRRSGIGMQLVAAAASGARAAGCEWLHVDFEDHLREFYYAGCGFESTNAGLIPL